MRRLLAELKANMTPDERDQIGLPSSVLRILPQAESQVTDGPPIKASKSKWRRLSEPERLVRTFDFKKDSDLKEFVLDLLDYETVNRHHAKITIQEDKVKISLWTRDLEKITESDIEYAQEADLIYDDIALRRVYNE